MRGDGDDEADRTPVRTVCVTVADFARVALGDSDGDKTCRLCTDALAHAVALVELLADTEALEDEDALGDE